MDLKRAYLPGVVLLLAIVMVAPLASATTWVNSGGVSGELKSPGWVDASKIESTINNRVWTNNGGLNGILMAPYSGNMPIDGIVWLLIIFLVPMVLGLFLGKIAAIIGYVVVAIALTIFTPGFLWGTLVIIMMAGLIIYRGSNE